MSLGDFYKAELNKLLSDKTTTLERMLKCRQIVYAFQIDFPHVHQFFCSHARELLHFAFTDSKNSVSTRAFQILSVNSPDLLKIILSNGIFLDSATDLLVQPNIPQYILGRLSSITLAALKTLPKQATQSTGFIYQLLPHCQNPSVFNFFETICSPDEELSVTHHWLNQMGFSEFILRELESIDYSHVPTTEIPKVEPNFIDFPSVRSNQSKQTEQFDNQYSEQDDQDDQTLENDHHISENDNQNINQNKQEIDEEKLKRTAVFYDPIFVKTHALLTLISRSIQNQILAPGFYNQHTVECLCRRFQETPTFVENARWEAVLSILCLKTIKLVTQLFNEALVILTMPFEKLEAYRISALQFITKMMKLDPNTTNALMETSMLQMLIGIVLQFPNSSILHSAFREFVTEALRNNDFGKHMITLYTPVLIDAAKNRENRVLGATAIQVIKMFAEKAADDPETNRILVEGNDFRFYYQEMMDYLAVCNSKYGGDVPVSLFKSIKEYFKY